MVEGIDIQAHSAKNLRKTATGNQLNTVRSNVAFNGLLVMNEQFLTHTCGLVLVNLSTHGHGKRLHSATDAQNGDCTCVGQQGKQNLLLVALGVYGVQQAVIGFLTHITRVYVGTACKQECINVLQGLQESIAARIGRDYQRSTAGLKHRCIISLGNGRVAVTEIGGYAHYGTGTPRGV